MKQLKDLASNLCIENLKGSIDILISNINFDSRKIRPNDLFIAIRGTVSDGHKFVGNAVNQGATAIVCDTFPEKTTNGVTYIKVKDTNKALGVIATNFYGNPSKYLKLTGVTGTNGKTTVASLLYQLFKKSGHKSGLFSTVKIIVDEKEYNATHTTPDSITINRYLREMVDAGVEICFMEVSSHGIHQKRIEGLQFAGGIFTKLTQDHLDYHGTFAKYLEVKKSFFDHLPCGAFALTNIDDENGTLMLRDTAAKRRTYALKSPADYHCQVLENTMAGLSLKINNHKYIRISLIGSFNAYNILASYGAAINLGLHEEQLLRVLPELEGIRGRFQFMISKCGIIAVVDCADTPDPLENVLNTINSVRTKNEQLITVIGCIGSEEKHKRPAMADIASTLSDKVVLTSDDPRDEDPENIIFEMKSGVQRQNHSKTMVVVDRKEAIKLACQLALPGDIILIAGKGHETHQEVKGVRHYFDDMATVTGLLKKLDK